MAAEPTPMSEGDDLEALEKAGERFADCYLDNNHPWRVLTGDYNALFEACPRYPQGAWKDAEPEDLRMAWLAMSSLKSLVARIRALEAVRPADPAAEAGVGALREALEPFARKLVDVGESETDEDIFDNGGRHNRAPKITAGDIRRAHEVLAVASTAGERERRLEAAVHRLADTDIDGMVANFVGANRELLTERANAVRVAYWAIHRPSTAGAAEEAS